VSVPCLKLSVVGLKVLFFLELGPSDLPIVSIYLPEGLLGPFIVGPLSDILLHSQVSCKDRKTTTIINSVNFKINVQ